MRIGRFTPSKGADQRQAVGKELLLESEYLDDRIKGIAPQYRDDVTILPGGFGRAPAMCRPRVREPAGRYGVPYVDCSQGIGLGNEAFHDLSHLAEPSRELREQRPAEELAAISARESAAGTGGADEVQVTP